MTQTKTLSSNMEDYLEAIFNIVAEKQAARSKDIATRLNVKNSSVTGALRLLGQKGYINYAPYDVITLTAKGNDVARDIVRRHEVLCDFFTKILGVENEEAEETACKMEHGVSHTVLDRIIRFVEFIQICPRGGEQWIKGFNDYFQKNGVLEVCGNSIARCLEDMKEREKYIKSKGTNSLSLAKMKLGQRGTLLKIKSRGEVKKQFDELGINPGSVIELEQIDDREVKIKTRGYHLLVRNDDAAKVELEIL